MTELQLEILFGGMGYVQNVRIVEDVRTGANKGYAVVMTSLTLLYYCMAVILTLLSRAKLFKARLS